MNNNNTDPTPAANLLSAVFPPWKKLHTPPLLRLRPTVASLPNCSGPRRFAPQSLPPRDCLAVALKGGEWLRVGDCRSGMRLPSEKIPWPTALLEAGSAPLPSRGGVGVGSVTSSANLLSSVLLSANLLSSVYSRRKKSETPPLPLPLRGGEWLPPENKPHGAFPTCGRLPVAFLLPFWEGWGIASKRAFYERN